MYQEQYLELDKLEVQSMPPPLIDRSENSYQRLPSVVSEPVDGDILRYPRGIIINDAIPDQPLPAEVPMINGAPLAVQAIIVNIAEPDPVEEIGMCRVLVQSPFVTLNRPDLREGFFEMLCNLLAPKYKYFSVTTVLALLPLLMYIVLNFTNRPPFLKLPYFSIESVNLTPYRLKQFQFYRLYTAPFVFTDLNETLLNCLLTWIVGSNVQDVFGWKMICVLIGFPGLIGASTNICFFMLGLHSSFMIMEWPNPNVSINIRRVQITIYAVITLLFFLLLLTQQRVSRLAIFSSTIYGFLLGFIMGIKNDRQPTSFRKLAKFMCTVILIFMTSGMLFSIVFYKKTIV